MSEKELIAKMDAALAQVDPGRRKFLGILLAGVAAVPLLTSASLAAEGKAGAQKTQVFPKNATKTQGNTALKNNAEIKHSNSTFKNNSAYKNNSTIKNNAEIKHSNSTFKNNSAYKDNSAYKNNIALKNNSTIKNSSGANTAIKGETKPVQH